MKHFGKDIKYSKGYACNQVSLKHKVNAQIFFKTFFVCSILAVVVAVAYIIVPQLKSFVNYVIKALQSVFESLQ